MEQEMRFNKDPARYLLYQHQSLTGEQCQQAELFSEKIFDKDYCQLCEIAFDLSLRAPRILVHCGHCFCTSCLYLYYRDQRVKCPLCKTVTKNLYFLEILPLNQDIHQRLIQQLPQSKVDVENKDVQLPSQLIKEIDNNMQEYQFNNCQIHPSNLLSIICQVCDRNFCKQCVKQHDYCDHQKFDLQILRPKLITKIVEEINGKEKIQYEQAYK